MPASTRHVLLYAPNLVGYVRLALLAVALVYHGSLYGFAVPYVLLLALDYVDGALARRLDQTSAFGAFLDVFIDNLARACAWSLALAPPWGALVPALEWTLFACTHAQGGGAWKNKVFGRAPLWVSRATARGLRNPLGAWVMAGIYFLPLWIWADQAATGGSLWLALGGVLAAGRLYGFSIELWVLGRHMRALTTVDS